MQAENLPFDPYLRTYVDQLVRDAARKHECYAADIYNPRRRRPVRCGGVSAARYAVIRALQQTVYRRERSVVEKRTRTDGQKIRIVRQAFHYIYRPPGIDSIPAGYRPISGMAIARLLGVDHSLVVRVLRNGESRKTKGEMGEGRKGVAVENKTVE